MVKQIVVYTYKSALKKEGNSAVYNMDGPYVKQDKPVTEREILHDSIYVKYLQQSSSNKQRVEWWLSGARRRGDGEFYLMSIKLQLLKINI